MPQSPLPSRPARIAILGGGITGLAAAHRLRELCPQSAEVRVTLFEAGSRLGGSFGSQRRGDFLIETGADSFITNKPALVELARRLGLESQLIGTDPRYRRALLLHQGRPVPVPAGFQLLAPGQLWPVLRSPLLSWKAKLRLAAEPLIPSRRGNSDESLANFVRRRLGNEVLERIVQPLVGGIYTSDPEQLSLEATLPRFLEMEREHGSLIRALQRQTRQGAAGAASGARYDLFMTFKEGMQQLIDSLQKSLADRVDVRSGTAVDSVSASGQRWRVQPAEGEAEEFDAVIIALGAKQAARVVETANPRLSATLKAIPLASSAIVVTGHDEEDIESPLDASGLVIPHRERRRILAVSFLSRKFPSRAPAGKAILRTFVGGALQPKEYHRSDEEIVSTVLLELRSLLGVKQEPDFAVVARYPEGMPQFTLGHRQRVESIRHEVRQFRGLAIAGNYLDGVGLPDCVASGEHAAAEIWKTLPPPT